MVYPLERLTQLPIFPIIQTGLISILHMSRYSSLVFDDWNAELLANTQLVTVHSTVHVLQSVDARTVLPCNVPTGVRLSNMIYGLEFTACKRRRWRGIRGRATIEQAEEEEQDKAY